MIERTIDLNGIRKSMMLCRIKELKTKPIPVVMEKINEQQEEDIEGYKDKRGEIAFACENGTIIPAKDIYLYGEVDFENEEDISLIKKFNLIDESDGCQIHSNFDYDKGTAETIENIIKTYPTWNAVEWFKYCHCLIGKPKRIIVYKISDKHGNKRKL